jgi:hypothetical protein
MVIKRIHNTYLLAVLGTPNPGPYANAITAAYYKWRVQRVILLYIEGDAAELTRRDADALSKRIWEEIDKWESNEENNLRGKINVYSSPNQEIGNRGIEVLHINSIVEDLERLVRRYPQEVPIIDITGATKVSGVDTLAAAALLGLSSYSFELTKAGHSKPSELKSFSYLSKEDYTYEDLLHRTRVNGALGRLNIQSRSLWVITLSCMITTACLVVLAAWKPMNSIVTIIGLLSSVTTIAQLAIPSLIRFPRR